MKRILFYFISLVSFFCAPMVVYAKESVVCLHAFLQTQRSMSGVKKTFEKEGFNVYVINYDSRKYSIEEHAEHLIFILNRIAKENPGEKIHFVTHSVGGVILRAAVNNPHCPQEALESRAVLLAPPHNGSSLARKYKDYAAVRILFGPNTGRQLMTYTASDMSSKFGEFPPSLDVMVIAGNKSSRFSLFKMREANDGKVTINETKLSTKHTHIVVFAEHSWMTSNKRALSLTKAFILKKPSTDFEILKTETCCEDPNCKRKKKNLRKQSK